MAIYVNRSSGTLKNNSRTQTESDIVNKYLGTSYILNNKEKFEPGRTSDFILKVKFNRDLVDMEGEVVCDATTASETLALSLRDYAGPTMTIDKLSIRTGNGQVNYAGVPSVGDSSISFTDYIGAKTEHILLAWYTMAHNALNDKIGFKEYYAQDGILYKWAPNGTRQISWWLLGCWINEFNLGQFSRNNPDLRQFSTTLLYDKIVPFEKPDYTQWTNKDDDAYLNPSDESYYGTQNATGYQYEEMSGSYTTGQG